MRSDESGFSLDLCVYDVERTLTYIDVRCLFARTPSCQWRATYAFQVRENEKRKDKG